LKRCPRKRFQNPLLAKPTKPAETTRGSPLGGATVIVNPDPFGYHKVRSTESEDGSTAKGARVAGQRVRDVDELIALVPR